MNNQEILENTDNFCVICNEPISNTNRMTCSPICHEKFIKFCEERFGITKIVEDEVTGIMHLVPTRDIIEKGLRWEDLPKYPKVNSNLLR